MRIWTGRAGSGKTTAILREIAALSEKGEGRQILLVPELNSHLMERRLAAATHNHGARRPWCRIPAAGTESTTSRAPAGCR